jgi:hypothetical protein
MFEEPKIIKNFIPKYYQKSIEDYCCHDKQFPWYYLDNISNDSLKNVFSKDVSFPKSQYGFYHLAYNNTDSLSTSPVLPLLIPLVNSCLEILGDSYFLTRIRLGLKTNIGVKNAASHPHVDFDESHMTALYYVNDSDGDTVFYDQFFPLKETKNLKVYKKNTPQKGTVIIFNGLRYHSSGYPFNVNKRVAVNINFSPIK